VARGVRRLGAADDVDGQERVAGLDRATDERLQGAGQLREHVLDRTPDVVLHGHAVDRGHPLVHVVEAADGVDHGHADAGALDERHEELLGGHGYSSRPLRIALATAAARSETPSFS
jgi:hypothetical protein